MLSPAGSPLIQTTMRDSDHRRISLHEHVRVRMLVCHCMPACMYARVFVFVRANVRMCVCVCAYACLRMRVRANELVCVCMRLAKRGARSLSEELHGSVEGSGRPPACAGPASFPRSLAPPRSPGPSLTRHQARLAPAPSLPALGWPWRWTRSGFW